MPDFSKFSRFLISSSTVAGAVLLAGAAFGDLLPPSFCIDDQCVTSTDPITEDPIAEEPIITPGPQPQPEPEPPVDRPAPGKYDINWNPGLYFGYRGKDFHGLDAAGAANKIRKSQLCRAGAENVQGLRVRFNWRDLEPNGGGIYDFSVIDGLLELFRTGGCDNRPRRLMLITDFFATNKDAKEKMCVPPDLENQAQFFENGKERRRCVAPVWRNNSAVQRRYRALVLALAERYKNEPLIEYLSAKGEGALGYTKKDDPTFSYHEYFDFLMELAREVKQIAPSIPYAFGSNNYQSGFDDWLVTKVRPMMDEVPGMGIRWPDTFHHSSWNSEAPFTNHHKYYPAMAGKYMMAGDLQIPGNRFDSFENAWQSCCNPKGYRGVGADNNAFTPASGNHTFAATHVVALSGYADFPLQEAARVWNSHSNQMYSKSCPTSWTKQGARCVTGRVD